MEWNIERRLRVHCETELVDEDRAFYVSAHLQLLLLRRRFSYHEQADPDNNQLRARDGPLHHL
jgi:hypothetical protein